MRATICWNRGRVKWLSASCRVKCASSSAQPALQRRHEGTRMRWTLDLAFERGYRHRGIACSLSVRPHVPQYAQARAGLIIRLVSASNVMTGDQGYSQVVSEKRMLYGGTRCCQNQSFHRPVCRTRCTHSRCPSPKPRPPRLASVRAVLTGRPAVLTSNSRIRLCEISDRVIDFRHGPLRRRRSSLRPPLG